MKKKYSLLLMVMLLFFGMILSACNSKEGSGDSNQPTNNAEGNTGDKEPLGKYENPVTVTMVSGYRKPEDPKTPKGITPQTNGYVTKLKEMLNIDLKYDWEVPNEQFEQKFSLAIASGDFPDIMSIDMN
ncbi:hypothetical protein [Bacillus subtilis]|uniref:hypothetical protein n=1 Tax=Lederbergia ruris TaxID=217495 RepID=UPI00202A7C14